MKLPVSLNPLVEKTKLLEQLNQALIALLPPALIGHCHLLNYREKKLIIECDSAAWLARLRFDVERLLKEFQKKFTTLTFEAIEMKVHPAKILKVENKKQTPKPLTHRTRVLLQSTADHIQNKALRAVLLKLSQER